MSRTIVEFMIHYLGSDATRERAIFRERKTMEDFELEANAVTQLQALNEAMIIQQMKDELRALTTDELVDRIMTALREVGFDAVRAWKIIYGGESDCEPAVSSLVMAASYGEGEIHVRGIRPSSVPQDTPVIVEIRGQGFGPSIAVRFVLGSTTVNGSIMSRRCDVDVHQYLRVGVTLSKAGDWTVQLRREDGTWKTADCKITAV
jgi:hypothetical protein